MSGKKSGIEKSTEDIEKSIDSLKKIGYIPSDKFNQKDPYRYPAVKMPKGEFIKLPRKGSNNKKSYTENFFFQYLTNHFAQDFTVLNDSTVPPKTGMAYKPDFVLYDENKGNNIFLNIEIDEPYEGFSRTSTHEINSDNLRDLFFQNRGWIVIRFAEIQIHQEPEECCLFIANVIKELKPDYIIPIELKKLNHPSIVEQWNKLQSNNWAKQKYREKYLGIKSFSVRGQKEIPHNVEQTDADIELESLISEKIPQSHFAEIKKTVLGTKNSNRDRDQRISFDAKEHRYFIDGNPDTISVSELISKFFQEFDEPYWSKIKAAQRGISPEMLRKEWREKAIDSSNKGTYLHEQIENFYQEKSYDSSLKEFCHFLSFKKKYPTLNPYLSEWRIFDESLLIGGTVDMLYEKDDGSLIIFDWKRSLKVVDLNGSIINSDYNYGLGKLNHIADNSYNKYCLQLNLYRHIIETKYNKKISSMNLLILHPDYESYFVVKVPKMQSEVDYIIETSLDWR